jgi:5-hydroxyisourate hydrolase
VSHVTTHVLDAALGRPAAGVAVDLSDEAGTLLGQGVTDADGRVADLGPEALVAGVYRLTFHTAAYFEAAGRDSFWPRVVLEFQLADASAHHHVPLLLSPFAFTTYRGS